MTREHVTARTHLIEALLATALCLVLAAPAAASVKLHASPGLKPSFKRYIVDYVARCKPGEPLHFDVTASDGFRVAVGGHKFRGGHFHVDVTRRTGEQVTVSTIASDDSITTHHVRCLPLDFPRYTVKRYSRPQAAYYVLTPIGPETHGYVAIFDARGVPLWWRYAGDYGPWDGKLLQNGDVIWSRQFNDRFGLRPEEAAEEHRLDGSLVRTLQTHGSPTDMHDVVREADGNYLLDTYRKRAQRVDLSRYGGPKDAVVFDAEIQELAPDGSLLWKWNSKNHIPLSWTTWWPKVNKDESRFPPSGRAYDLVHINSMDPDRDGGIVVSARFVDAVFRIDKATGKIDWKLGGTHTKKSLKVKDDPLASKPLDGNHDARVYGDDSVTVHDNGTLSHRRPRAVRYVIDTKKRTATLVEDLESEFPRSGWGGSARKLPGGNWVVYWGGDTRMSEIAPNHQKVLDLTFQDRRWSYRAIPVPRGQLRAAVIRHGMNALAKTGAAAPR